MPRAAYIFLKYALMLADAMLLASALLFALAQGRSEWLHLAALLLETPAGVLLCACLGLAFILDRCRED